MMGWGTTVRVYLSRVGADDLTPEHRDDLIRHCRDRLLMLAAATPRTVQDGEGNPLNWEEYIHSEIDDIMGTLEEEIPLRDIARQIESGVAEVVPECSAD